MPSMMTAAMMTHVVGMPALIIPQATSPRHRGAGWRGTKGRPRGRPHDMTFIGIDISERRGCAVAALDASGRSIGARWALSRVEAVVDAVRELARGAAPTIGIDAPRMPLPAPRPWYWDAKTAHWRARTPRDRGWGRHCEVIIASLGLANPQWTPMAEDAPTWMRLGFDLFDALQHLGPVHEIFPTAAYRQLAAVDDLRIELPLTGFADGPKDMLDAYLGAVAVREFVQGRGACVGDGDHLGGIVLPRPVARHPAQLFDWPG